MKHLLKLTLLFIVLLSSCRTHTLTIYDNKWNPLERYEKVRIYKSDIYELEFKGIVRKKLEPKTIYILK